MHVKLTLLLTNSMQTKQQIAGNNDLKKINLPSLTTTNSLFVVGNTNLEKLCASELEIGGAVCIGNNQNQPFLDADLSELVTGGFQTVPVCYQEDSNAPTVCGADGGLFSPNPTGGRCPSNACL